MEDSAVWKALADETRRGILDSLKSQPATTGELCEEFAHLDRCTVMKHLAVLEQSNLITLRRHGRHRMNFLNPVPLQKVHTRWLSSYTARASQKLLELKDRAEKVAPAMPIGNTNYIDVRAVKYAFDVDIAASPETVWQLITTDISTWWLRDFNSSPDTQAFRLEPRVGGRMYEDQGNDNGVLWGTVVQCAPPNRLQIQGAMFPDYGGPGTFHLSLQIEKTTTGCVLKVSDAMFGHITDEQVNDTRSGWLLLFGTHLKEAAEKATP